MTTAATASSAPGTGPSGNGVGGLLGMPAFRGLIVANVLSAIAFGTSRFVFVWLVGELTEWNPATAILGILIGLPPLLLSAWAGSLADHIDPRRLGVGLFAMSAAGFGVTGLLVATDVMTVPLAMVCGFVTAIAPSMIMPQMQALVPAIVPAGRLMQGVALQNLSMMVSVIAGVFLGGAVIQAFGVAAGFWLITIAGVLGALRFATMPLPDRAPPTDRRGAVREGLRIGLGTQPLRSLLGITAVMGLAIATSTLLLPEFARDVLGNESLAASALNVFMSLGMMATSMVLATRWTPSRPGLVLTVFSVTFLGGGLIAIGSSRAYLVTALFCLMWGLAGGVAMTLLRTLTQMNTPPELMGRVMGLSMMAQNGAFPIGALLLVGLVSATSVSTAMVIAGFICVACTALIAVGPHVRRL
ncbi:MAG: MFS transporter [Ilumatobacter sp.]|uniref:MFS transporter n=1 Tax=Ilumatobacter sp. TaxID=1967498 RepID=UPI00261911ED|nr:MFS transporter [Ilumatobacter sp.]MDJ0767198.1 MFS transporter [Ilumatobacter sp.]